MVVLRATLFHCINFSKVVTDGKQLLPVKREATAGMPEREQGNPAFLVMYATCKMLSTTHHQLPAQISHHNTVRKRLHQPLLARKLHSVKHTAISIGEK